MLATSYMQASIKLYTDSASSSRLITGYEHDAVNHTKKEYARGDVHENRAECLLHAAPPAAPAPACPAAGPTTPWALAGCPARRPRPPARPATRRRAGAHGLARHHCWRGTDFKGDSTRLEEVEKV